MAIIREREDWNMQCMTDRPRVVRVVLLRGKDYLTFAGTESDPQKVYFRYAVVGTAYGHLHRVDGEPRFWQTYSGAYKAMRRYVQ